MKVQFLTVVLGLLIVIPCASLAQPFEPGHVLFADPGSGGDQVVELELHDDGTAEIISLVQWPLLDTKRRRPLGLDVAPDGTAWVGVTGEPTSVTEEVQFPTGRVEVIALRPDGTQQSYLNVAPTNKATFLSTFHPNEVFIMSNSIQEGPSIHFRVRMNDTEVTEVTEFIVSQETNFFGEALELPDGRILIGSSGSDGIQIFDQDGGEAIGMFVEENRYRSLTYIPEINRILALRTDQSSIDRMDLEGNIEDTLVAADWFYPNLWGVARMPGTTKFLIGSHNGPEATQNFIGIFDASDFSKEPEEHEIVGFENVGLPPDHRFVSLFNMAVTIEPTYIDEWSVF